jgi:dTDP-glucose pyrophosphorylase/predicted transcriptional regulator
VKSIDKLKIFSDSTIKQALKIISDGAIHIAIVVDRKDKFIGTLSDGDIRRGFLKGLNLKSPIKSLVSKKPIFANKKDTEEKLLKIALSKKIYQIPVVEDTGKVIGIHVLDELIRYKDKSNKVVIMAGGKGMRLRPLTKNTPKPMLKVGDKPILQTLIEKFRENGYKNFVICVNYKSNVIKDFFSDGDKFGVKIEYIQEKSRMGTAGALSLFKKKPTEPFFVINGDLLTNLDFEKLLNFHYDQNSEATMCVREYNIESPYGEVKLDNEKIKSIEEKPKHKYYVNAGVYVLEPKCISLIPKKYFDMPSLFKIMIKKNKNIVSFPLGEYWLDIGKFNDYKKANIDFDFFISQ